MINFYYDNNYHNHPANIIYIFSPCKFNYCLFWFTELVGESAANGLPYIKMHSVRSLDNKYEFESVACAGSDLPPSRSLSLSLSLSISPCRIH